MVIGCGAMASAIINGWHSQDALHLNLTIVTPRKESLTRLNHPEKCKWFPHSKDAHTPQDYILFAVKPYMLKDVLAENQGIIQRDKSCVISVAAGKAMDFYGNHLPPQTSMIRTMPNTPSAVGAGITLMLGNQWVSESDRQFVDHLMQAIGTTLWVQDDDHLDKIAALTGCGPAYVFQFVESLMSIGTQSLGLSVEDAGKLAQALVSGSAKYMALSHESPEHLRQAVTSKGGMTQAALDVLRDESNGLENVLKQAIEKAYKRAVEMRQ